MDRMRFTSKGDVWSYGVLVWEMFTFGDSPRYPGFVPDQHNLNVLREILMGGTTLPVPQGCNDDVHQKLMKDCWSINPENRPVFLQLTQEIKLLQLLPS